MRASIPLGRIGGVAVGLNYSVLVIVAVLIVGLGLGRFPIDHPGLPLWLYLAAATATALLFLASLLAHELAHALVARRYGIEVAGITLWLLGGVAQLVGEARTPRADLRIAAVGPGTSLGAAVLFGLVGWLLSGLGAPSLLTGMFGYLAAVNVLLAVFNLIPAAPLDGGRVLRAILWARWGDRARAAIAASRAGRGFGSALIVLGFLLLFTGPGFQGLWLALIGWFLVNAASAEEQQARLGAALHGIRVGDIMSGHPVTAAPDETVAGLIDRVVMRERLSTYPLVAADGALRGLVTLNRIRQVPPDMRPVTLLSDIACPPGEVPTAHPDDALTDLLQRMSGCADGRAVVLDSADRLVGIVTPSDISRAVQTADLRADLPYSGPGTGLAATGDRPQAPSRGGASGPHHDAA